VIVIADEIYSLLTYSQEYATLDEFYPQGTIVSSGMSKWCGAGGWRLGFVHIPAALGELNFKTVVGIASETYSCAASPIQLAAHSK
jgi:aspartate aminotransferase